MITKQYPISWLQTVHLFCINKLTIGKKILKTIYFLLVSEVVKSETIAKSCCSRSPEIALKTLKAPPLFFEGGCCILSLLQMFCLFPYIYFPVPFSNPGKTLVSMSSQGNESHGLIMQCVNKIFSFISFQFPPSSFNQSSLVLLFKL